MSETKLQSNKDLTPEEQLALANAMLDASFDDIQDLAKFAQFPKGTFFVSGVHSATIGMNQDNTQVQIKIALLIDSPIELAQFPNMPLDQIPADAYPPAGSIYGVNYQGPMGIQKFKSTFEPIIKAIDPMMSPRALVEMLAAGAVQGMTILNNRRADKEKVEPSTANPDVMVPVTYNELVTVMSV